MSNDAPHRPTQAPSCQREAEIIAARTPREIMATLDLRDWLSVVAGVALFVVGVIALAVSQPI